MQTQGLQQFSTTQRTSALQDNFLGFYYYQYPSWCISKLEQISRLNQTSDIKTSTYITLLQGNFGMSQENTQRVVSEYNLKALLVKIRRLRLSSIEYNMKVISRVFQSSRMINVQPYYPRRFEQIYICIYMNNNLVGKQILVEEVRKDNPTIKVLNEPMDIMVSIFTIDAKN